MDVEERKDGGEEGEKKSRFVWRECPKVVALVEELERLPGGDKALVFSQFVEFLKLIALVLEERGIGYCMLTGSMSAKERVASCAALQEPLHVISSMSPSSSTEFESQRKPPPVRVMLASLKAGGQGLNLTSANHAFIMDPWWNAAVEEQAAARVHRIGQTKPCVVTKFVVTSAGCVSVEGQILKIQDRKAVLGKGALQRLTEDEARRAKANDIKSLVDSDQYVALAPVARANANYPVPSSS